MMLTLTNWILVLLCHWHSVTAQMQFIAVGDWGDEETQVYQRRVAEQMDAWAEANGCDFIFSTGDNFYPQGVTSNTSVRFDISWRSVYNGSSITDLDWYITVGNHDHYQDYREMYQVEFSAYEPRWKFPYLWYSTQLPAGDAVIHLIAIDTEALLSSRYDNSIQLEWLEEELASSTGDWIMVIGHHPPLSVAWPEEELIFEVVVPLLEEYNADFLVSGHDHNLQHITKTEDNYQGVDYVISGGGGYRQLFPYNEDHHQEIIEKGYQLEAFEMTFGFVAFVFDETSARFTFQDDLGNVLYEYTRTKA